VPPETPPLEEPHAHLSAFVRQARRE
jgi:hypothetical protein